MDGSISLYNIVISYIGAAVLAQEWGKEGLPEKMRNGGRHIIRVVGGGVE